MIKKQNGSINIVFLSLLPVFLALAYAIYLYLSFSDSHLEISQHCLEKQIALHEDTKKTLRALFKLNPKAMALRAQYYSIQTKMAALAASGNFAAASALRAKLALVSKKRQLLDLEQKSLIQSINAHIHITQLKMQMDLNQEMSKRRSRFQVFADFKVKNVTFKSVKLAVKRDDPGPAPTYNFSENFLNDQALELKWDMEIASNAILKPFFNSDSRFSQSCSTTINHKEAQWPTVTREVRSLLKRSS